MAGAAASGEDRCLVADVRQVRAGEAAGLLGDQCEVDVLQRLVACVHPEDPFTALDVGRSDEHLAIEAPWAKQRGVELLQQV